MNKSAIARSLIECEEAELDGLPEELCPDENPGQIRVPMLDFWQNPRKQSLMASFRNYTLMKTLDE